MSKPTKYETTIASARNYLMRGKLLKTVEDITYGISVLELERTGEVTKLIQEVDSFTIEADNLTNFTHDEGVVSKAKKVKFTIDCPMVNEFNVRQTV